MEIKFLSNKMQIASYYPSCNPAEPRVRNEDVRMEMETQFSNLNIKGEVDKNVGQCSTHNHAI
jgi:hypothetical protein